jgi:hypothetical protein
LRGQYAQHEDCDKTSCSEPTVEDEGRPAVEEMLVLAMELCILHRYVGQRRRVCVAGHHGGSGTDALVQSGRTLSGVVISNLSKPLIR